MRHRPFLTLVALDVLITLIAPRSWLAPICALLLAPLVCGALAPRLFALRPLAARALLLAAVVAVGALLRPYWWAVLTDRDFTFDNEPEVEFVLGFVQFAIAGIAFVGSSLLRQMPPPNHGAAANGGWLGRWFRLPRASWASRRR